MTAAYFYVEYTCGKIKQNEFKTAAAAQKAYKLYCKNPEESADSWGWDLKYDKSTLAQQIREKRISGD
jgi:hypothetical protein